MKSRYLLSSLFLIGLTACGQEVSAPGQSSEWVNAEGTSTQNMLRGPDDEVTAEEIQQRREAWVRTDDGAASRMANAEASKRE